MYNIVSKYLSIKHVLDFDEKGYQLNTYFRFYWREKKGVNINLILNELYWEKVFSL